MTLPTNCRLCGADRTLQEVQTSHVYGGKPEHAFYRCRGCDVVYLYPQLNPDALSQFYANDYEEFMVGRAGKSEGWQDPDLHVAANQKQVERRMRYISRFLPEAGGRVLEVGCSSGFMLYPLKELGYRCCGLEPSASSSEYVRSRGIPCFRSLEELEASPEGKDGFDLIMHFFVIDYQNDPLAFLERQVALLGPKGKIVFEVPSVEDALITVYDIPAYERFLWSVEQSYYFTEPSLRYLLEKTGRAFEIIRDQRYDLSNHLVWARDGKPGGMGAFTSIIGEEIENQYRQALIRAGRSDTLIGVVKS